MIHKRTSRAALRLVLFVALAALLTSTTWAQSIGSAGTVTGVVTDPNGAVVPGASVTISNPVTGYTRTTNTDTDGSFRFNDVPPNNYHVIVSAGGFNPAHQDLVVRTSVPISLKIPLAVGGATETVTVTSGNVSDVIENVPSAHVDVDKTLIDRLPLRDPGSGLSTAVTLAAPGVAADSNGGYHPLGDHFESNLSLDNQPISDQQSKFFSTQIPVNIVESMEVITGATPAEYGDKTSLVVNAITKSGLNQKRPAGSLNFLYGTFGTTHEDADIAYGNERMGNFVAFNFDRSGRFLDAPEFTVLHDRGTAGSIFDRFDYSPNSKDTFHGNLFVARNDFQTPNTFDQQAVGQDQRQLVHTINFAPGYVHVFGPTTVLTVSPYFRLDNVKYFSSPNPFADQPITFSESRRLNNVGV
ncbi:MAG: TonB-dependent receptor [Acidobacteriota bacterium]|nr:TonB-dependent receptor [Acidobacteriota bacterium]